MRGDISEKFQEVVMSVDRCRCGALVMSQHGDRIAHRCQATTSVGHHLSYYRLLSQLACVTVIVNSSLSLSVSTR